MSSIVLKIPIESQSFRAVLTDATLRDRVLEWAGCRRHARRRGVYPAQDGLDAAEGPPDGRRD